MLWTRDTLGAPPAGRHRAGREVIDTRTDAERAADAQPTQLDLITATAFTLALRELQQDDRAAGLAQAVSTLGWYERRVACIRLGHVHPWTACDQVATTLDHTSLLAVA